MDFPKQGHALVIVAHPDDEILEFAEVCVNENIVKVKKCPDWKSKKQRK
ncbi:MAG TPA: hypothetical protein VMV74_04820 [Bacteroidales bacterium]|nr:hypothetical protein [Bacteroidales bacterium]